MVLLLRPLDLLTQHGESRLSKLVTQRLENVWECSCPFMRIWLKDVGGINQPLVIFAELALFDSVISMG